MSLYIKKECPGCGGIMTSEKVITDGRSMSYFLCQTCVFAEMITPEHLLAAKAQDIDRKQGKTLKEALELSGKLAVKSLNNL